MRKQDNRGRTIDPTVEAAVQPWPVIRRTEHEQARARIGAAVADLRPAHAGLRAALREVCLLADFTVGHLYLAVPARDQLIPAHLWEMGPTARLGPFVRASMATMYAPGVGLPGQAMATRRPACIASIDNDPKLMRARVALSVGLRSAYAFPVLDDEAPVAVLEFLSVDPRRPDPNVEALLGGLIEAAAAMLAGGDFKELVRHEVALAEAANLLQDGLAPLGVGA